MSNEVMSSQRLSLLVGYLVLAHKFVVQIVEGSVNFVVVFGWSFRETSLARGLLLA